MLACLYIYPQVPKSFSNPYVPSLATGHPHDKTRCRLKTHPCTQSSSDAHAILRYTHTQIALEIPVARASRNTHPKSRIASSTSPGLLHVQSYFTPKFMQAVRVLIRSCSVAALLENMTKPQVLRVHVIESLRMFVLRVKISKAH